MGLNRIYFLVGISLILIVFLFVSANINKGKITCNQFDNKGVRIVCGGETYKIDNKYQGPLRSTDDETTFRNTGTTKHIIKLN
jgi:hypothetical protein